jgi:hypothetical protein
MKKRLCKITVTLGEEEFRWARIEAARKNTKISRLLGRYLKDRMVTENSYKSAMLRALKRKPFLKTRGRHLSRAEAHVRGSPS